ncbi:hypothetical protein RQP46_000134 [Phenoliferia psychrophenolica]
MLTTSRLVAIPLPALVHDQRYRDFYRSLLEDVKFCDIAFGSHLLAKTYTDAEIQSIFTRKLGSWNTRGFGDFGLALLSSSIAAPSPPSTWAYSTSLPPSLDLSTLEWIGYICIRDALSTSITTAVEASPNKAADFPPWEEMVEIKYGLHESGWGKGYVPEAVKALQEWSAKEFGVRRFIGCTKMDNEASARVLQKLGYRETTNEYFQEEGEDGKVREWECVVARDAITGRWSSGAWPAHAPSSPTTIFPSRPTSMAAFALLPSEILAHILNLSNEGESAQERQRSRFSFGLIARASFLATADATDFYVAGEKQAKALAAKLEREKKILLPLKQLRILDLEMKAYGLDVRDVQLDQLALSHFHTLRIRLHSPRTGFPVPFNNTLLRALATGSTSGIHVLDLTYTTSTWLTSDMVDSAVNHIASVVHFIWTPELVVMGRGPRKALTRLLRGMVNLQSITIATWLRADSTDSEDEDEAEEYLAGQQNFIDPKLLDVLANVPSLHTVNLVDSFGMVEEHALISFIEKRPTLRFLTVKVDRDGWTQEHKDRVERASEGAGVVFLYHGNNV